MSIQRRIAKLENFQQRGVTAWIARELAGKDQYLVGALSGNDERLMTRKEIGAGLAESVFILPKKCKTVEEWAQECKNWEAASGTD